MRPNMCTPQPVQACRWIVAFVSTTLSFCAFSVTSSLSRGTTPTSENMAPSGFQLLVQPQAWLNATSPLMRTFTCLSAQWQTRVPPAKLAAPALTPLSNAGCIDIAAIMLPPLYCSELDRSGFVLEQRNVVSRQDRAHLGLVGADPLIERVFPFLLAEAHAHRDLVVELDGRIGLEGQGAPGR